MHEPHEERLKEADFTKAYYNTKHGILVNPNSDVDIKAIEDVFKYEFGVQTGTTMAAWAESKIQEGLVKESQVKYYTDANAGALDVKNGQTWCIYSGWTCCIRKGEKSWI